MLRIFTKLYLLLIRYLFSLSAPSILYVGWWCSLLARSPPTLFPLSELPQPPLLASALADVFRASHMQLSSRYQSQYRPQFLIPTLLEHCSHKSIVHHLPECSRDLSHSIPTFLGCGKRIKTSGGQFLSIVIQNVLWRPPYAHISIRAPTPRQKHEHICTIHRHTCTCLYIWMHMCTKKKKKENSHTHRNLCFCGHLWWYWHWWLSWKAHFEKLRSEALCCLKMSQSKQLGQLEGRPGLLVTWMSVLSCGANWTWIILVVSLSLSFPICKMISLLYFYLAYFSCRISFSYFIQKPST